MSDIIKIKEEYLLKLKDDLDLNNINQIKSELFGKNGKISNEFKKMGSMSPDSRKKFASDLNAIKDELQETIEKKIKDIEIKEIRNRREFDLTYFCGQSCQSGMKIQMKKLMITDPGERKRRGL